MAVLLHCIIQIEFFVRAASMVAKGRMRPVAACLTCLAYGMFCLLVYSAIQANLYSFTIIRGIFIPKN